MVSDPNYFLIIAFQKKNGAMSAVTFKFIWWAVLGSNQ